MPRTLMVMLEIDVDDLSPEERIKHAQEMNVPEGELSGLQHVRANCIGERLACIIDTEALNMLVFEGSDDFVKLTEGRYIKAVWTVKE